MFNRSCAYQSEIIARQYILMLKAEDGKYLNLIVITGKRK